MQKEVLKLENQIIDKIKNLVNGKCLNETKGADEETLLEYKFILDAVLKIVK